MTKHGDSWSLVKTHAHLNASVPHRTCLSPDAILHISPHRAYTNLTCDMATWWWPGQHGRDNIYTYLHHSHPLPSDLIAITQQQCCRSSCQESHHFNICYATNGSVIACNRIAYCLVRQTPCGPFKWTFADCISVYPFWPCIFQCIWVCWSTFQRRPLIKGFDEFIPYHPLPSLVIVLFQCTTRP